MVKSIFIDARYLPDPLGTYFSDLLKRRISKRVDVNFSDRVDWEDLPKEDLYIDLHLNSSMAEEMFRITHLTGADKAQRVIIEAGKRRGLMYGIGKFLRTAEYEPTDGRGFRPGDWQGESTPAKEVRGMYFATHFRNFYHCAPVEAIEQYLEDLALWGYNALMVWFDMHHFHSIHDLEAQAMIAQLRGILIAAHKIDLQTGLLVLGNEAYEDSPVALRGPWQGGQNGYIRDLPMYHLELCPSNPQGYELLLRWRKEVFRAFADLPLNYVLVWPYDQGGCGCADCAPWGGNGFLKIARPVAQEAKRFFPSAKVIVSTWYFDCYTQNEFETFSRRIEQDHAWLDYVMAEHPGKYPDYILKNSTPGDLPLLGFPEISMYNSDPWGGFGANPLPAYLSKMWDGVGQRQVGGFPYSEGIFEDLNKAILAAFYWNGTASPSFALAQKVVEEYANFYFSSRSKAQVVEAVQILETTNSRERLQDGQPQWMPETAEVTGDEQFVISHPEGVDQALNLLKTVDQILAPRQKQSWRWRILYLRALIDYELAHNGFRINDQVEAAFEELIRIYHAEDAVWAVRPPSRRGRVIGWS